MANSSLSEHAFARPTLIGCHVVTFFDSIPSAENPRCTIGQTNRTRACQGVFALYYIPRVKCHLQGGPEQNAGLQFWGPFCATISLSVCIKRRKTFAAIFILNGIGAQEGQTANPGFLLTNCCLPHRKAVCVAQQTNLVFRDAVFGRGRANNSPGTAGSSTDWHNRRRGLPNSLILHQCRGL